METLSSKDRYLIELIDGLGIDYEFERSYKICEGILLGNRFLAGISTKNLGPEPHTVIRQICERIDIPLTFLEALEDNLAEASYIFFGFEESQSSRTYKAYLEYWEKCQAEAKAKPGSRESFLLYLGFKWNAQNNTKRALTEYVYRPYLSFEEIHTRVADVFQTQKDGRPLQIAGDFLKVVSQRITSDQVLYLDVTEENNPRKSFDINVYKAGMLLKELYPVLQKIFNHFAVPAEKFHDLYNPFRTRKFGHLSGGIGRDGKEFFTIYFAPQKIAKSDNLAHGQ